MNVFRTTVFHSSWPCTSISTKMFSGFCEQASCLLESSLSLAQVIEILSENTQYPKDFRTDLKHKVLSGIRSGERLSAVVESIPSSFPPLFPVFLQVAEYSGDMSGMLREMATIYSDQAKRKSEMLSILLYPTIILSFCMLVLLILGFFVIPRLEASFFSQAETLPLLTRIMLTVIRYLPVYILVGVALYLTTFAGIRAYGRVNHRFRERMDKGKLHVWILGRIRFLESNRISALFLSILLHAGIPIPEALEKIALTQENLYLRNTFLRIQRRLYSGQSVSQAFDQEPYFEAIWVSIMRTAEYTGDFEGGSMIISIWYDQLRKSVVERLSKILEPALTAAIGLLVGLTCLALILPVLQSYQNMAQLI